VGACAWLWLGGGGWGGGGGLREFLREFFSKHGKMPIVRLLPRSCLWLAYGTVYGNVYCMLVWKWASSARTRVLAGFIRRTRM